MKKEYDFSKMREVKSPFKNKKSVGINLSHEVIDYFKALSKKIISLINNLLIFIF